MTTPEEVREEARASADYLLDRLGERVPAAVVLGSGWGALAAGHRSAATVDFAEAPGFPLAGAPGHAGRLSRVETGAGALLVQEGRPHCYEGLSSVDVCFPVWVYGSMGVRLLVMMSAAGGLNPAFIPGDLVIVSDHISLFGPNPLSGIAGDGGGAAFVPGKDMYSERWKQALRGCLPADARVEQGVYAWVPGPSYETPAEATMLRVLGADVVGMSTVPEAITARYLGMEVAALSCVSNSLIPAQAEAPTHERVLAVVREAAGRLEGFLESLAREAYMVL